MSRSPTEELEWIDRGFADLLSCFCGGKVNSRAPRFRMEFRRRNLPAINGAGFELAIRCCWSLTQGLDSRFRSSDRRCAPGKQKRCRSGPTFGQPSDGSAAAFVFTGDFPPESTRTIRPSMTPPHSRIGLSGLMSADHRYMAQTMRDMRPALKS